MTKPHVETSFTPPLHSSALDAGLNVGLSGPAPDLRQAGVEMARLFRDAAPAGGVTHPSFESAAHIIERCKLHDKRSHDVPQPTLDELRELALATGRARALQDLAGAARELDGIRSSGAAVLSRVDSLAGLPPIAGTLAYFALHQAEIEIVDNPFGLTISQPIQPNDVDLKTWHREIDVVLDNFEIAMRRPDSGATPLLAQFGRTLRDLHGALTAAARLVERHAEPPSEAGALLMRSLDSIGRRDIALVVADLTQRRGAPTPLLALTFAQTRARLAENLELAERRMIPAFLDTLRERLLTPDSPRVRREMDRLDEIINRSVVVPPPAPTAAPAAPAAPTVRANLAERFDFLRDRYGDRFDGFLDEISRKVGPQAAIDRFHLLARCCRSRTSLAHDLIAHAPAIMTLSTKRFERYIGDLRRTLQSDGATPIEQLGPDALGGSGT